MNENEYVKVGMFWNDINDEPQSWDWGHSTMDKLTKNEIPYKLTSPKDEASEVTIWVSRKDNENMRKLLKEVNL